MTSVELLILLKTPHFAGVFVVVGKHVGEAGFIITIEKIDTKVVLEMPNVLG